VQALIETFQFEFGQFFHFPYIYSSELLNSRNSRFGILKNFENKIFENFFAQVSASYLHPNAHRPKQLKIIKKRP